MLKRGAIFSYTLVAMLGLASFISSPPTSALTYQEDVPVSFTFNRSISVAVSSDLHIYNLTPGTNADSNIITVSTATNNATGYVLSATVGNGTHTNPTYNTTNITNKDNSSFAFSSLATNSSIADMTNSTDNTWGYSFSQDNGTNWTNYSGLPIYTGTPKELISTNSNAGINIKFKIGAKASSSQPSGEYTNIINFVAVTNAAPPTIEDLEYMQEFATLSSGDRTYILNSMTTDAQYQLKDSRDEKTYYVSKLRDGNVWMTQNLDLDLDSTKTYTPADTNIPSNWTPSLSTWSEENASCLEDEEPAEDCYTWENSDTTPSSYDPGNLCWSGVVDDNTPVSCAQNGNHYHLGNYYNWTAAIAMNDSSGYTTDEEAVEQSICPAGWTLPFDGDMLDSGSFYYLLDAYGLDWMQGQLDDLSIWEPPLYFILSGESNGGPIWDLGSRAVYLSNTVFGSSGPNSNVFVLSYITSNDQLNVGEWGVPREDGNTIHCVAYPFSTTVTAEP